jgi:hypothetical protein
MNTSFKFMVPKLWFNQRIQNACLIPVRTIHTHRHSVEEPHDSDSRVHQSRHDLNCGKIVVIISVLLFIHLCDRRAGDNGQLSIYLTLWIMGPGTIVYCPTFLHPLMTRTFPFNRNKQILQIPQFVLVNHLPHGLLVPVSQHWWRTFNYVSTWWKL